MRRPGPLALSLACGFALSILVTEAITAPGLSHRALHALSLARWLHVLGGTTWIGLLYHANLVQAPAGGVHARRALALRRWSALATWLTGLWYLDRSGNLANAATLGMGGREVYGLVIGIGGWLGTLMLLNLWTLIWRSQRRALGAVPVSARQRDRAQRVAAAATRANFILSIPMLLCMTSAFHGLPWY